MVTKDLGDEIRAQRPQLKRFQVRYLGLLTATLERILGLDETQTRLATQNQRLEGRTVEISVSKSYFVCRKYLNRDGSINYVQTCFCR